MSKKFKNLTILKPVSGAKCVITSRYWDFRVKWGKFHSAYDFAPIYKYKAERMKVFAGIPGRVVQVYHEIDGFGLYVKIKHLTEPIYAYKAHLQDTFVTEGDVVIPEQCIGVMGHSGNCYSTHGGDATHLHDEYREIDKRGRLKSFDAASYYKDWDIGEV